MARRIDYQLPEAIDDHQRRYTSTLLYSCADQFRFGLQSGTEHAEIRALKPCANYHVLVDNIQTTSAVGPGVTNGLAGTISTSHGRTLK